MDNNDLFNDHVIVDDNELVEDIEHSSIMPFVDKNRDLCEDISTQTIPQSLEEIELQIDRLKRRWGEFTYLIGQRLKHINDSSLYEDKGYSDFSTYVRIALKMSETNAYYYIAVFDYFTEEQTRMAGSKLKLIIPVLNKLKKDSSIPEEIKDARIKDLRNELFSKIYNKTYREAEKIIKDIKVRHFTTLDKVEEFRRVVIKTDKIIIYEDNKEIREELFHLIEQFYLDPSRSWKTFQY